MKRLFATLPLIAVALANIDPRDNHMGSSKEGKEMNSSSSGQAMDSSSPGKGSGEEDNEITIDVGHVQIKIVGSFNGEGKWVWESEDEKPADDANIHQVTVGDVKDGKPIFAYDPPSVDAIPGDYVQFNFKAQNHTVTQSTFEKPCVRMQEGIDSGFMPNPNNTMREPPSMMVAVNDTNPLWFYCRQATHCGKGMAFGINPGGEDKMAEFLAMAKAQNGTEAGNNGTASGGAGGLAASNSTSGAGAGSGGNGTTSGNNGLPASSAVAEPTGTPLSNLVPGDGQLSNEGGQEACVCNCLCDLGQPGMGGLIGSMPFPNAGAPDRRAVRF